MKTIKRIIGGFAIYNEDGSFVKKFTGQGAKKRAEKFIDDGVEEPDAPERQPDEKFRGDFRGRRT